MEEENVFEATEEQIKQMGANAYNASSPVGLGIIYFIPGDIKADEISLSEWGLDIDYLAGRMVKLMIKRKGENKWEVKGICNTPREDYQSWARRYPTIEDLKKSAGIV